jgi:hypothetical protein
MLLATVRSSARKPASAVSKMPISKVADRPYAPGDGGIWVKSKLPNPRGVRGRWRDRPGRDRRHIAALLLDYDTADGRLHDAGRAGTGIVAGHIPGVAAGDHRSNGPPDLVRSLP